MEKQAHDSEKGLDCPSPSFKYDTNVEQQMKLITQNRPNLALLRSPPTLGQKSAPMIQGPPSKTVTDKILAPHTNKPSGSLIGEPREVTPPLSKQPGTTDIDKPNSTQAFPASGQHRNSTNAAGLSIKAGLSKNNSMKTSGLASGNLGSASSADTASARHRRRRRFMVHGYHPTITPMHNILCGLPISTFIASVVSGLMYLINAIILISIKCENTSRKIYIILINIFGLIAVIAMTLLNMFVNRYRFDGTTLTVSLVYSGSACLILFGLIHMAVDGLCEGPEDKVGSIFQTKFAPNYIVWFIDVVGLGFQIVGHYYFG